MSIKLKAVERMLSVGSHAGQYRYMLSAELYNKLSAAKVMKEASLRSGISRGAINASWDAIGEVIKTWATEGHSVAIPGLGTMRFGVRAKSVEDVNDVASSLVSTRRVIFTPTSEIKQELSDTSITITCYDRNGKIVKRVTSGDSGFIEEDSDDSDADEGLDETDGTQGGGQSGNQGGASNIFEDE